MTTSTAKTRIFLRIGFGLVAAFLIVIGVFYISGFRSFIIQTPSMGTYAPVGTLVVSKPASFDKVQEKDTILFNPPGSEDTFFHRVDKVADNGILTKGDINGTVDPWTLGSENLIGAEFFHVQSLGFLIRVLPFLIVGGIALTLIVNRFIEGRYKFPTLILGSSFLLSIGAYFSRPFFNSQLIAQTVVDGKSDTTFVSTGVFGVQGTAVKGTSDFSRPGELATVHSAYPDKEGLFNVVFSPYLQLSDWIVIIICVLLPTVLCTIHAIRWNRKHPEEPEAVPAEATAVPAV